MLKGTSIKALFLIGNLFLISPVFAVITKISVNEATASKLMVDETTSYILGGSAGSCSETKADSVCDSCSKITSLCGTVDRTACNNRSVHKDLQLEINFQVDQLPANSALYAKIGTNSISLAAQSTILTINTDLFLRILWSELLSRAGYTGVLCDSSASGICGEGSVTAFDLTVGLTVDSGATFSVFKVFKVEYRGIKASARAQDFHTDCGNSAKDADANEGFCEFSTYPGDGKVYVKDLQRASTGPSGTTYIKWRAARFYYTDTGADFCGLAPSLKTYKDLEVADRSVSAETSLVSTKIEDLNNGTLYRFMMASVDDAGNVEYFSNPNSSGGYLKDSKHSVTPTEVVGLLDGKKCFVATAAFGSEMDPHVETLRNFRDQIMLKSGWGRFLVKSYYRYSPPLAKVIADKTWLRTLVRGFLWPIVGLAKVVVEPSRPSENQ